MGTYIVVDASVFILGKEIKGELITVPSVEGELKDLRSRMALQISNVRVEGVTTESLKRATRAAMETGDVSVLSPADLELLAKALEYVAPIATDDYAVQNVAVHLGLEVIPVAQQGIKREKRRTWRCPACGKAIEEDNCPVCGTPARKHPRKRKRGW